MDGNNNLEDNENNAKLGGPRYNRIYIEKTKENVQK